MSINKRKCFNCEDNHSIWSFQCKIKMIEKNRISNIWRTKSMLYSTEFKKTKRTTFDRLDIVVQSTFIHNEVTSSTSSSDSFIKEILTQNEIEILKSIMHLKTKNYTINEITSKRTLSLKSDRSMSSSFRQRFVNVVQMISSQTSNAFDVLKDHSNTRASQNSTQSTQSQTQSQTAFKSRERFFNSRKTIESRQNDEKLWHHSQHLQFYNTTSKMKRKAQWCHFWSIHEEKNMIY
jgi:hypothetical protein